MTNLKRMSLIGTLAARDRSRGRGVILSSKGYGLLLAHVLALALALVLAHALVVAAVVAALLFVAAAAAVAVSFLHFDSPGRSQGSVQKALLHSFTLEAEQSLKSFCFCVPLCAHGIQKPWP